MATKIDLKLLDRDLPIKGDAAATRKITIGQTVANSDTLVIDVLDLSWDGSTFAITGSLTVTGAFTPTLLKLGGMMDVNGFAIGDGTLELLKFIEIPSAVNEITITNAATGNGPAIAASGDNTDVDLLLNAKGAGDVLIQNIGTGFMGFGTSNPAAKFHMVDKEGSTPAIDGPPMVLQNNLSVNDDCFITIISGSNRQCRIFMGDDGDASVSRIVHDNALNDLGFWTINTERLTIRSNGKVGINQPLPDGQFEILAEPSTIGFKLVLDATPGAAVDILDDAAASLFHIDPTGQVGVGGVSAPNEVVQINDAIAISDSAEGATARLVRRTTHETHTLSLATTSDTTTITIPSGARLLAVSFNVNTAVTNGGDNTWSAAFITGSTTSLATGAAAAVDTKIDKMLPDEISSGICEIQFTPQGGSFTAGVIEIVAYYEELTSLSNV